MIHISQSNYKSITTLGGLQHILLDIRRSPQCYVILGSYQKVSPFSVWSYCQPWGSVGILHNLAIPNNGGYSKVLTTYNGQSESPWKYQYYNPYWLSSGHNNGIIENHIFLITMFLYKYFITVAYPLHS